MERCETGRSVRPATADDLPAILAIERGTATAPHWPEAVYRSFLEAASLPEDGGPFPVRRLLCAAPANGGVRGFAAASVIGGPGGVVAELETIAVEAAARRLGLGAALCRGVIRWSRAAGAQRVQLEVRAGSLPAHALYTGLGFVVTGQRRGYYRDPAEDALLFDLVL